MPNHWSNIEGCLTRHRDLKNVEKWLARARKDLSASEFAELLNTIMRWLVNNPRYIDISEELVKLLSGYDPRYTDNWLDVKDDYKKREAEQREREFRQKQERQEREKYRRELERQAEERERYRRELERQAKERESCRRELERQAEERERYRRELEEKRKKALMRRCREWFDADFLSADAHFDVDPECNLLTKSQYAELKSKFVQAWANRVLGQPLDVQQAAAVACIGGDIQVVARAGAGKTRTLVTRALFLLKHCGVPPGNLLLLAFNKAAALEMRQQLEKVLGEDVPHVMTFHALAYALVHPKEALVYDEPSAGSLGLSSEIQRVIDAHLQSKEHRPLIRDLMLMHFREDWERIVEGGFHLPIDELIEYRSTLPRETFKGEYVKSFGERLIANTLFQNDIDYKYERNYRWNGINYRPDFTILLPDRRGIVIEYFGLVGNPEYDEMSQKKRDFWVSHRGWNLLEFTPKDIASRGADGFAALLIERLSALGVQGRYLSEEELWELIRRRAIDKFTAAMKSFVSRCRKLNLSVNQLRYDIDRHTPIIEAERLFLEVGVSVYLGYVQRLASSQQEDFDGLMWRAIKLLEDGHSRFVRDKGRERVDLRSVRFVLIDEFQDFSEIFYRMSQGIRSLSQSAEFFCVGDDWQAINGFAGSDLRYFENFGLYFRAATTLSVTTNYRSPVEVVEIGNALMKGLGEPAVPSRSERGLVSAARFCEFSPSTTEYARHNGDEATPAVLRLVKHILNSGRDVVMLTRRNDVPWYVSYASDLSGEIQGLERFAEHIRSFLPEDDRRRVTASTAHKYKGLEKDAVIVLDADQGCYPLIHPNWVFLRVFGDRIERIEAEERRLLYVALTRSRHSLVVLCDTPERESPYLIDIKAHMKLASIDWVDLAPLPSLDGAQVEVRVSNAYSIRDHLKQLGYRWNAQERCWCRSVMAEGFEFQAFCGQPWVQSGVRIEVRSESGELVEKYLGG